MITGEDIDRCIVEQYAGDLADMTVEEAKGCLSNLEDELADLEGWVEALHAFIRIEEASIS